MARGIITPTRLALSVRRLGLIRPPGLVSARPILVAPASKTADAAVANSVTSSAFVPLANYWLYAFGCARNSSGNLVTAPTISDTVGLSWSVIRDTLYDDASSPRIRGVLWRAQLGASTVSMTVTAAHASAGNMNLHVFQMPYGSLNGNVNDALNAAGDPSASLPSAPAGDSMVLATFCFYGGATPTAPSGFTGISTINNNSGALRSQVVYMMPTAAQTAAWTTSGTKSFAQIVEIAR